MNSNAADNSSPEKRVQLPEPDMDNITVLTRELPNEPILPWHHYDSPWLESEGAEDGEGQPAEPTESLETPRAEAAEPVEEGAIALPDLATLNSSPEPSTDELTDDTATASWPETSEAPSSPSPIGADEQCEPGIEQSTDDNSAVNPTEISHPLPEPQPECVGVTSPTVSDQPTDAEVETLGKPNTQS